MKFTLVFILLSSVFIYSCKRTTNEEAYISALENSNTYILDANNIIIAMAQNRSNYDTRPVTQAVQHKINNIDSSTISYIKKLEKNETEITSDELGQFKKDLISNNIDTLDWDNFLDYYPYDDTLINNIPYQVAINEVLLLANQMLMYHSRNLDWRNMKIDKPQAIFRVDSNTYLALFAIGTSDEKQYKVTITSVTHKAQELSSDQYSFQYKSGFYGVIMNLTNNSNIKLGEYIINYEIILNEIGNGRQFKHPYSNIFIIEE